MSALGVCPSVPPPNTCTVALGVPDGAERGFYLLGFQMCFLPIFELEFVF